MSKCGSCLAEMVWAITPSGRRIPLDPDEVYVQQQEEWPTGLFRLERQTTGAALAVPALSMLRNTESEVEGPFHREHAATCPYADQLRKR